MLKITTYVNIFDSAILFEKVVNFFLNECDLSFELTLIRRLTHASLIFIIKKTFYVTIILCFK